MAYTMNIGVSINTRTGKLDTVSVDYDWDQNDADPTNAYICILDIAVSGRSIYDDIPAESLARMTQRIGLAMMENPPDAATRAENDKMMAEHRAQDPIHALIKAGDLDGLAVYAKTIGAKYSSLEPEPSTAFSPPPTTLH